MNQKEYRRFKPSGIRWIGDIPEDWFVAPIRLVAQLESGHTPSRSNSGYWQNCDVAWFTLADVGQIRDGLTEYVVDTKEKISELGLANSAARRLPPGTVILSRTASVGFSAMLGVEMATSQDFANWICGSRLMPRFLLKVFRAMGGEFERLRMGSTHNTIYMPDIRSMRMPLPPVDEQHAIVTFLDQETAKIDALVAEQRRLIALLKEKRQAVISHAVTKGLDPTVPMKDSGIEWLGEVPAHWGTPSLFARYSAVLGKMLDEAKRTGEYPIPYLRNADVNWDSINTGNLPLLDIKPEEIRRFTLQFGDILICEGGAGVGQTAIWRGELEQCGFQKALHRLRPWDQERENPRFLYYCMRYVVEAGFVLAAGTATIPHLTGEQLRKYKFPRPPKCEQDEIVAFLDDEISRFTSLETDAERAIVLLQERRTALISAAVTGKIDVRESVEKEVT